MLLGGTTLTISAPTLEAPPGTDADVVTLVADLPVSVRLGGPGSLVAHTDGSLTVLDDAGTPVAGIAPPDSLATTRTAVPEPGRAEVTASAEEGGATSGSVVLTGAGTALAAATWGDREGGRSLAVEPTTWARTAGEAGVELLAAELGAAEPEAQSTTMLDQLTCHAIGAPDKATWNLEPWRPDVGLMSVLAARCNP